MANFFALVHNLPVTMMQKKKFIIDTDPGLDDARALFFILNHPNVDVLALTITAGNGTINQTTKNASHVLHCTRRDDVPIFSGLGTSIDGHVIESDNFFGDDAFGNINIKFNVNLTLNQDSAHSALVNFVTKYPGEITLIALGPLTNLALAYQFDPEFPNKLGGLYILGGDRAERTTNNPSTFAGFNDLCDPLASNIVYDHFGKVPGKPINLIDWTFCQMYPIRSSFFNFLGDFVLQTHNNEIQAKILKARPPFFWDQKAENIHDLTMLIADEYAVVIAVKPSIVTKSHRVKLSHMITKGEERGHTVFEDNALGNIELIDEMDFEGFKLIYEEIIKN